MSVHVQDNLAAESYVRSSPLLLRASLMLLSGAADTETAVLPPSLILSSSGLWALPYSVQ